MRGALGHSAREFTKRGNEAPYEYWSNRWWFHTCQLTRLLNQFSSVNRGAAQDIALANAAASLVIAGKAGTIRDGMKLATESLDSGATAAALDKLIAVSNDID